MLEYWFKDRRVMLDFRRGPLGPCFDRFAAYLKENGYKMGRGTAILRKSCFFNIYLIEKGIPFSKLDPSLIEDFLDDYLAGFRTINLSYSPRT